MKLTVKGILIISLAGVFLFFTLRVLVPLVYRVKEPYFAMPIKGDSGIAGKGLLIRNDAYGEGVFGAKRRGGRLHKGIDLAAHIKSPVYASKSGWARSLYFPDGYGNLVIIRHPGHWETRYGHLDRICIKKFQWVSQGDIIGFVGKTGNADSEGIIPHLHFEIRYADKPLDPETFLMKKG